MSAVNEASDRFSVLGIVGTDYHPFDRFVRWLDDWAERQPDQRCMVQFGTSQPPRVCSGVAYLGHEDLQQRIQQASAIVTHGGPGTIMEVRAAGLVPLVLPRDPTLGEHVDAHQQRFTEFITGHRLVRFAGSPSALDDELGQLLAQPPSVLAADSGSVTENAALVFGSLVERLIKTS